jgi:pimeloyl-ACP methyl ester carboxylesterase
MSKVDVGGVSLYYEESGSGQPVVFVHGIPTDCRAWGGQVEQFSKERKMFAISRRYAAPNVREGNVSDSTIQNNAADLKGFIEKVARGPVDLVGHSYGGFISAFLAADHPDLVRNLVLVEPAISTLLVTDQSSNAQSLGLLLRMPSVALAARRFQTGSLKPSLKALDEGHAEMAVELNVDGVQDEKGAFRRLSEGARKMMIDNARTIAELRTTFPRFTAKEAGRISSPTMVVNGQETALWLGRIGVLTARAVPKARRVTVPGARHCPHMENPDFFNSNVLSFLEGKQ